MLEPGFLTSFLQVIMIDLVLAGDNAVVIGLAAAGLPKELRRKAIVIGIAAATLMRIGFALIATQLLNITGLLLAGGLLLLWVCWKMYQELRAGHEMFVNEIVEIAPDSQPPIQARDKGIGAPAFLLAASPIWVPALRILQREFGPEDWRQRRREQKALRMTNPRPEKLQQTRRASERLAQRHLGTAIGSGRQRDWHFFDGKAIAVQNEQALEKE